MTRQVLIGACAAWAALAGAATAQTSLFNQPNAPLVAVPGQTEGTAEPAKPRPKPKRRGPVPARALSIINASTGTIAGIEVSAEGKTAKLGTPLAPQAKAVLKLPAFKKCAVTVTTSFEGGADPDSSDYDLCKERTIRYTD